MASASASQIVEKLNLKSHPEGGFFSETLRDTSVLLSKCQLPPVSNSPTCYQLLWSKSIWSFCSTFKWAPYLADGGIGFLDKVDRPISTCIYFLLPSGSVSDLHRIPCAETWHFYMGEPLTVVELNEKDGSLKLTCLGPNPIGTNQLLQYTVPPNVWFGAYPTQDIDISTGNGAVQTELRDAEKHFSLVGCTCAPAFQFEDFELARRSELISLFPKHGSLINLLTHAE